MFDRSRSARRRGCRQQPRSVFGWK